MHSPHTRLLVLAAISRPARSHRLRRDGLSRGLAEQPEALAASEIRISDGDVCRDQLAEEPLECTRLCRGQGETKGDRVRPRADRARVPAWPKRLIGRGWPHQVPPGHPLALVQPARRQSGRTLGGVVLDIGSRGIEAELPQHSAVEDLGHLLPVLLPHQRRLGSAGGGRVGVGDEGDHLVRVIGLGLGLGVGVGLGLGVGVGDGGDHLV